MSIPTLPAPTPWPPFPPAAGLPVYFSPKKSDFTDLVNQAQGDAGDPSDGWDAAYNAWVASFAACDAALANFPALEAAMDAAVSDFMGLGDDLATIVAEAQAIAATTEASAAATLMEIFAPIPPLTPWSLPMLPALASFAAPALINLTGDIDSLIQSLMGTFESDMEGSINNIMSMIGDINTEIATLESEFFSGT